METVITAHLDTVCPSELYNGICDLRNAIKQYSGEVCTGSANSHFLSPEPHVI